MSSLHRVTHVCPVNDEEANTLINLLKATELLVEGQSANPKTKAANLDTSTAMWSAVVLFTQTGFSLQSQYLTCSRSYYRR